jgi:hypothetical protein
LLIFTHGFVVRLPWRFSLDTFSSVSFTSIRKIIHYLCPPPIQPFVYHIFLTRLRQQQSDPHALQLDADDASLGDVCAFGNEVITSLLLAAKKSSFMIKTQSKTPFETSESFILDNNLLIVQWKNKKTIQESCINHYLVLAWINQILQKFS